MNKKATLVAVIVFFLLVVGIFFVGKPVVSLWLSEMYSTSSVTGTMRSGGDFMEEVYEENSGIGAILFLGDMVENPADNKDWEEFFDNKQRAFGDP